MTSGTSMGSSVVWPAIDSAQPSLIRGSITA